MKDIKVKRVAEVNVPCIELLAAFRMSLLTAEREGMHGTAARVREYVEQITAALTATSGGPQQVRIVIEGWDFESTEVQG